MAQNQTENLSELLQIRRDKLTELQNAGQNPFVQVKYDKTHYAKQIEDDYAAVEGTVVSVAGRLMSKRGMGKVMFCDLQDVTGRIQLFVKRDVLGDDAYAQYKKLDIGDIVGAKGEVFTTQSGQISIRVSEYVLLSKSLLPLPEKFHGMTDTDLRYRQRYVDLIMNEQSRETFKKRTQIISEIRRYLDGIGFMEVETPVLHTIAGGASARPFITHHNTLNIDLYMRIALELHLKRLIVGGFEKVYEIGRVFRNEGMDTKHNPEFTLLELYEAYTDYEHIMDLTENLYRHVANAVCGSGKITYEGVELDFDKPFARISMVDAVKKYAGVDFEAIETLEEAQKIAKEHHLEYEPHHLKGDILNLFFDEYVEDKLVQPTFLTGHPVEISPLAKKCPENPNYTERFELFICGRECANAFSELNDPIDQKERFMAQVAKRDAGDDEANMMDTDYVTALEYGMPPTGGLGIGIDRMVMLFTGESAIRDVLLFPTMKPLGTTDTPTKQVSAAQKETTPEKIDFSNVEIEPLFKDSVDFETFSKSDFRAVKVKACTAVPKSKKLLQFTLDDGTGTDRTILSGIHAYYEPEELVGKTLVAITNLPPRSMMGIDSCGMLLSAVHNECGEEKLHLLMVDPHIPAGAKLY